jgi:hypothetical protein
MRRKFSIVLQKTVENKILFIRGAKVMLDRDLAILYAVKTKQLTRQVRRNTSRFPDDFMFQLTKREASDLRCQFDTSSWGGRRYRPYVFTEQGVAMISSVLNSERAIQVNIQIMRTFTRLRQLMAAHGDLKRKIEGMEKKYNYQFKIVFDAIKQLLEPAQKRPRRRIGFHA